MIWLTVIQLLMVAVFSLLLIQQWPTLVMVKTIKHCQITFISPGKQGEILVATARKVSRTNRNGLFDVEVRGKMKG